MSHHHWTQFLHLACAIVGAPLKRPKGRPLGRRFTTDAAYQPSASTEEAKTPSVAEQERDWLRRSCLTAKDLPGALKGNERTIEFFDIDGKPISYAMRRRFIPTSGFAALTAGEGEPDPKYVSPANEPPHLYFPQNGKKNFDWRKWAQDPKQRKLFVEGPAKAACATKFGLPAVGIQGCWGWRSVKHGHLMLPEFNDFVFEGCDVYWVPDRDRNPKAVANILRASNAFALLLQEPERGAKVHVVELPLLEGLDKVGIDDFLSHYSREGKDPHAATTALDDLITAAQIWQDYELTDLGNSRRWVAMYGSSLFRHVGRGWRVYREGCWRADDLSQGLESVKEMFEDLQDDAFHSGNSERCAAIRKQVAAQRIENVLRLAKADTAVASAPGDFDQHPLWVNCPNGVLEMSADCEGKVRFRPHAPEDMLTRQTAVPYVSKAKCPTFLAALDFWTDKDRDLQRTIQQLLGISLTGDTREQVFIILHGPGGTGKSTLVEIVRTIINNYSKTISSDTLLVRRNGSPEERKLAALPGVRFASCSETETGGVMDENLIKLLTGEDTVTGRRLYEEQFDFMPEAKIWLRTNNRPVIRGTGNDIWRRVIVIPFGQIVPEGRKDLHLKDKLNAEKEGIFAWMVEGYRDYAKAGKLFKAPIVLADIENYRKEQDVIEQFLVEKCEFDQGYSIGRQEFYDAYILWCDGPVKRRRLTLEQFKSEIDNRFSDRIKLRQTKKLGRRWWGVNTKAKLLLSGSEHKASPPK